MFEKIRNNIIPIYRFLLGAVLFGQILIRVFDYNEEVNFVMDAALYSLLGIPYIVIAWAFEKKILRFIFFSCGIYLVVMNFLKDFNLNGMIAIIAILTPLVIGRFLPEEAEEEKCIPN